ncbi:hypothetical protein TNCV_3810031 [Trichonephila clavipes]|nr:hypothetical protein TNCV_3810031 [Trichonephila clavipes]
MPAFKVTSTGTKIVFLYPRSFHIYNSSNPFAVHIFNNSCNVVPIPLSTVFPSAPINSFIPTVSSSSCTSNTLCSSAFSSLLNQTNIVPFTYSKFTDLPTESSSCVLSDNTSTTTCNSQLSPRATIQDLKPKP